MAKKEISHKEWLKNGQKVFDKDLKKFLAKAAKDGVNTKQVKQFLKAAGKAHLLGLKIPKKVMGLGEGLARVMTMPLVSKIRLSEEDGRYCLFVLGGAPNIPNFDEFLKGLMGQMRGEQEEPGSGEKKKENDPTVH